MIFCYKFRTFAEFWNFCLAKYRGRLIHEYSKTCIFLAKKQGADLYTDSTYTPENTVSFQKILYIYIYIYIYIYLLSQALTVHLLSSR